MDRFEVWRNENEDPRDVNFSVDCGKGTYVRSLVHDLGRCVRIPASLSLFQMGI